MNKKTNEKKMFTIYKKVKEIQNPKIGDVIKFKNTKVEILEVTMKGFFWVDGEESYKLRVKSA